MNVEVLTPADHRRTKTVEMDPKKLKELTKNDLLENEVWEYWMADNIEYVGASDRTDIIDDSNVTYIVVTDFVFKNRSRHIGFSTPQEGGDLEQVQPVILTAKGQVELYRENDWTEDEKNKALAKLGNDSQSIFPIAYATRVKWNREYFKGVIVDFNEGK